MVTGVTTHGSIERSIQELIAHDSRELCSIIDKDVTVRIFCNSVILEPYLMTRYIITHEIEAERFLVTGLRVNVWHWQKWTTAFKYLARLDF
jgi:hypothetical protein